MKRREFLTASGMGLATLATSVAPLLAQSPTVIRFAIVPAEDVFELVRNSEGLIRQIEELAHVKIKLLTPTDYTGVIEAMRSKKVDLAYFGPFSYILAAQQAGAEAFALGIRKGHGGTYKSYLVVRAESPYKTLADLRGKTFAFVDPASTSGNLFPRYAMARQGIKRPEDYFKSVIYAGGHDASVLAVKNGKVDGGAVSDGILAKLVANGSVKENELRVIASAEIPESPVAYRRDLPEDVKKRVREAFYQIKNVRVGWYSVPLERFIPISDKDYDIVRETARVLNLDMTKAQ
jgi:phosphonate transport system substrate-binding protein